MFFVVPSNATLRLARDAKWGFQWSLPPVLAAPGARFTQAHYTNLQGVVLSALMSHPLRTHRRHEASVCIIATDNS